MTSSPLCYINGKRKFLPQGRAESTLLQYLREIGLTGTKLGCDGMHVVTVEGIGNSRDGLHPIQERLANSHGSQCGFCTPGFVMSMYSLLRSKAGAPSEQDIQENLAGNLCRCTGYRPILDAFRVFAEVPAGAYTEEAIAAHRQGKKDDDNAADQSQPTGYPDNGTIKMDRSKAICPSTGRPSVEPIFPPELRKRSPPELHLPGPYATWHRPLTLERLLMLREQYPEGKIVVGNTEIGIEMKYGRKTYPIFIAATHVAELNSMEVGPEGLTVGAAVTLSRLMRKLKQLVADRPKHETRTFQAMGEQMKYFAGNQIRNTASVGGNICTASPISDLNPIYMSTGSVFNVQGEGTGVRKVAAKNFFLGYRKVDMQPHEVLLNVHIPFTKEHDYIREYKQAHRRDDDIAIANAGMRVRMEMSSQGEWVVAEAEVALGGVAPRTIMAPLTMAGLQGRTWNKDTLHAAINSLAQDVYINSQSPGGMVEFRRAMVASFFFRFFMHVAFELDAALPGSCALFPETYRSGAIAHPHKPLSIGMQYFSKVPGDSVIGQPFRHAAAHVQVTGEAQYTDDIPLPANALHAALVYSDRPHAKLLSIDPSAAYEVEGMEGFFCAKDVPGHDIVPGTIPGTNQMGSVMHDEEVFALDEVKCVGQVIGVVVADTEQHARMAAQRVKIGYEDLPSLISCEDAIKANSYFEGWGHRLDYGDVDACFASGECDQMVEGTARIGGQEHFYLEPHCSIVIPQENSEICIYASTQAPNHHMETVAEVLGIPSHKVVCHVKRIGGGFGGKESRSVFTNAAIAVAAYRTRRPVRLVLDRAEDMQMTGHRHAFFIKYKVRPSPSCASSQPLQCCA
ncbi:hypothetical protein WJX84_010543 [Apatococcus fuscideae]|uniref:FAD-binding PCMH-type domain-containing protein n=1 Tax=Apatococcus fuscideae TaxID=2026836 RepID=A0AAW1SV18_9CHLO